MKYNLLKINKLVVINNNKLPIFYRGLFRLITSRVTSGIHFKFGYYLWEIFFLNSSYIF